MGTLPFSKLPASTPSHSSTTSSVSRPSRQERSNTDEEEKIEELTFEEIRDSEEEMRKLARAKIERERKEIREKKEKDALLGRQREVEKISIDEIGTSVIKARKQGELPEHIAALPKKHPIRVRWEKGYRQREDGSWHKTVIVPKKKKKRLTKRATEPLLFKGSIAALIIATFIGVEKYQEDLLDTREEILTILKEKRISLNDPWIREKYGDISKLRWLPSLEKILAEIRKRPRNFDIFPSNPEPGSYLEYIQRHDKPFDARDAMEWESRLLRKPHKR